MVAQTEASPLWQGYARELERLLSGCQCTGKDGASLSMDEGMHAWTERAILCRDAGGEIIFVGNGASASMASHFAADIMKNAKIKTRLYTDLSLITAGGNDLGYENAFSYFIERFAAPKDMLVSISSSGQSANILRAADAAGKKGATIITLSAFNPDNSLRKLGDLNFYIETGSYGFAESAHAAILHFWMDRLVRHGNR